MKKTLLALLILVSAFPAAARSEDASTLRGRGDALRAEGRFEEAVEQYKRALAEEKLLPDETASASLRGKQPILCVIARHRAEIGGRLASSEGR